MLAIFAALSFGEFGEIWGNDKGDYGKVSGNAQPIFGVSVE
jgi:hypothetical protein